MQEQHNTAENHTSSYLITAQDLTDNRIEILPVNRVDLNALLLDWFLLGLDLFEVDVHRVAFEVYVAPLHGVLLVTMVGLLSLHVEE